MPAPTTAVIGAGISGLTAGKMLNDYGVPYTCFEKSDRVGGNWAFDNPNGHSSAYQSLHIDTSKHQLSFRDFPMPEDYPDFPHHTQIKDYLDAYTDTFGLREHIEFGNGVEHVERLADGGWEITDEAGDVRHFDLLAVANGHHWDPRTAVFPGEFTGETIHSHAYVDPWTPLHLMDKRILVVGLGNSAADITVELSQRAMRNDVTLSTRSSAWIVPKLVGGKAADMNYRTIPQLPLSWQRKVAQWGQRFTYSDPTLYGLPAPNHKFFEAHPTQSGELPLRLKSGDVTPQGNIARLDGQHGPLRGRHECRLRRDHLRDRLQHHVPVLRRELHQRTRQPDPAVQADVQARHRQPGVHGLRPGHTDVVPLRGGAGTTAGGVRRGPLRTAGRGGDGTGDRRRPRALPRSHARPATAHPPAGLLRLRARPAHPGDPGGPRPCQWQGAGMNRAAPATRDRRPPQKGDQRRSALLQSLDHHLQESSLDSINIADISRRAGVTRSAFYFYFENKAAAVAALMEELYDEVFAVARLLTSTAGTPSTRIETMILGLFEALERHKRLFGAMLEARASSEAVRDMWDADRLSFVSPLAEMIQGERDAGRAPAGPDPVALATVLLELNDRALERVVRGSSLSRDDQITAVTAIWLRTIYGTIDGDVVGVDG